MCHFIDGAYKIGNNMPYCVINGMIDLFAEQATFLNAGLMIYTIHKVINGNQKLSDDSPLKYSLFTYLYPLACAFM